MNSFEKALNNLMPEELKVPLAKKKIPSLNHCAGTGKLLGQFYGAALSQVCNICTPKIISRISMLSVFMRTFIVLDDFIKDSKVTVNEKLVIQDWLQKIKKQILHLMELLNEKPNILWNKYHSVYESAYNNFAPNNPFSSIMKKCYFIFLPFELEILNNTENKQNFKTFIKYYLFSLQLVDDFRDMIEDVKASKNHNLFLVSIKTRHYNKVINNRHLLLNPLLDYILVNLNSLKKIDSKIVELFLCSSLNWLKQSKSTNSYNERTTIFCGKYENFIFDEKIVEKIPNTKPRNVMRFNNIRAENMHTLTNYQEI